MYYYTLVVLAYATFLLDNFNVRNKEKYSCLFAYVFFLCNLLYIILLGMK